jgi:transposase
MFGFGAATRIYVATGAIDMRKGFNGLYGIVRNCLAMDPESGHLFLFSNAKRDRMKVIFFDGSGLWVCSKLMQGGRLKWPQADGTGERVQLSSEEFSLLVAGIDLTQTHRRKWYRKPISEEHTKLAETA